MPLPRITLRRRSVKANQSHLTRSPSPPGKYFKSVKTYSFTQTDKALRHHINFTLDQPYFLRAIISYDFLWNNLNLRLRHVNPSATTGTTRVQSSSLFVRAIC